MKQKYAYIASLGMAVTLLSSISYAQNGQQILRKTIDLYLNAKSIQTVMVTKTNLKLDGKTRTENSRMVSSYQKPNLISFEIGPVGGKVAMKMVSNGAIMSVFDAAKNSYFQLKPSAQAGPQAPVAGRPEQTAQMLAMLFPGTPKVKSVGSNYMLTNSRSQSEGEAKQNMAATLVVDQKTGQMRSLSVIVNISNKGRSLDNEQSFVVESQKINQSINSAVFRFVAPKGAKKVAAPKPSAPRPGGPSGSGMPGGPRGPRK